MADQKRTELDWEDVRVFMALARHGSLSAAARALAVNHATIARRVQSLERSMGERLVERRPDGYALTPAGMRVLGPANDMEAAAATLSRGGADDRPAGLVRVNAPPSLSQNFLVQRLAWLCTQHPGLDIDVATDFRAVSLERREADVALRFERPQDGDVIAKPLVSLSFGFYATADTRRSIEAGAERCSSPSTKPTLPFRKHVGYLAISLVRASPFVPAVKSPRRRPPGPARASHFCRVSSAERTRSWWPASWSMTRPRASCG
jgi:molybdate transport repressor ModE-like protein